MTGGLARKARGRDWTRRLGLGGLLAALASVGAAQGSELFAQAEPPARWRKIAAVAEAYNLFAHRPSGVRNLIVYAPRGADGRIESDPALDPLGLRGFAWFTLVRAGAVPPDPAADRLARSAALDQLFAAGERRPGYRKRILAVHGTDLAQALQWLRRPGAQYDGLWLIDPALAWPERSRVEAGLAELPERVQLLAVESVSAVDRQRADLLFAALSPERRRLLARTSVAALARLQNTPNAPLTLNEATYERLYLMRLHPRWTPAMLAFPRGCRLGAPDGPAVNLVEYRTNAAPERNFCPQFMENAGRELFRAVGVSPDSCSYRQVDTSGKIYCSL